MNLANRSQSFQLLRESRGKMILGLLAAAAFLGFAWLFWSVSRTFEPSVSQLLRAAATLISVPILLAWFHNNGRLRGRLRKMSWVLVLAIIAVFVAGSAIVVILNVIEPSVWDFLAFWLDGQVAVRGLNIYEPTNYQSVPLPISAGPSFTSEILDVGFRYPPPTILLFMPLGLFDFRTAIVVWYTVHGAALALCAVLLWKIFLEKKGLVGFAFAVALVAVAGGTFFTFIFAQTNFLALLMVLLFWRYRGRLHGGVWLALGALIKPLLLVLLAFPILRKNGRVLLVALGTAIALSVLTIGLVGTEAFLAYIVDNPAGRMPEALYTETVNQSLFATILRLSEYRNLGQSVLIHPAYISSAIVLTTVTCWLLYSLRDELEDWGLVLVLMLAVIIYPVSQVTYGVFLVVPILMLWARRNEIPLGVWGSGALITAALVLSPIGGFVFFVNILLWTVFAALLAWMLLRRPIGSIESPGKLVRPEVAERTVQQPLESIQ